VDALIEASHARTSRRICPRRHLATHNACLCAWTASRGIDPVPWHEPAPVRIADWSLFIAISAGDVKTSWQRLSNETVLLGPAPAATEMTVCPLLVVGLGGVWGRGSSTQLK
jgi:hypothetical protein